MTKTLWYRVSAVALLSLFVGTGVVLGRADAPGENKTVDQVGTSYNPSSVEINIGESVTWNADFGGHPLLQVDGPTSDTAVGGGFSYSGSDPSFTKTFNTAGTFYYQCTFHGIGAGTMRGEVVVVDPNATPDTPTPTVTITATPTQTATSTATATITTTGTVTATTASTQTPTTTATVPPGSTSTPTSTATSVPTAVPGTATPPSNTTQRVYMPIVRK